MMHNGKKEAVLRLRIDKELRDKYRQICEENALNGSELIRRWVAKFVEEHEKSDNT